MRRHTVVTAILAILLAIAPALIATAPPLAAAAAPDESAGQPGCRSRSVHDVRARRDDRARLDACVAGSPDSVCYGAVGFPHTTIPGPAVKGRAFFAGGATGDAAI